ncbi:hypothetical protein [Nocardia sp. NPDC052112]|uniref:hypothetical protein n=1 Tax=Nocardia sp. NPDC052112 TaxID=3155646 RepID=UPI003430019A
MASTTARQSAAITAPAANISGWRLARRGLGAHSHVGGVRWWNFCDEHRHA